MCYICQKNIVRVSSLQQELLEAAYPDYTDDELQEMCGKTYFDGRCSDKERRYLKDAKLIMSYNLDDMQQGIEV